MQLLYSYPVVLCTTGLRFLCRQNLHTSANAWSSRAASHVHAALVCSHHTHAVVMQIPFGLLCSCFANNVEIMPMQLSCNCDTIFYVVALHLTCSDHVCAGVIQPPFGTLCSANRLCAAPCHAVVVQLFRSSSYICHLDHVHFFLMELWCSQLETFFSVVLWSFTATMFR